MAEVEFIYNEMKISIQCELNDKMKDIFNKLKDKIDIKNKNIYYSYNGQVGINEELKFEEIANTEDKKEKK